MDLDRFDIAIINQLRQHSRISWAQLAERISLSSSAIQRRVQAMQDAGIIANFSVVLNNQALGNEVKAFVQVKIQRDDPTATAQFRKAVMSYPEVESCHKITGNMDYIVNVICRDLSHYNQFLENKILFLPSVNDALSALVLDTVKENGQYLTG